MVVKLRLVDDIKVERLSAPVQNTSEWEVGQLISYESNYAVALNAAAEDATFLGVAADKLKLGDTFPDVVIITKGIFEADAKAASYDIGDALAYNASNDNLEASTDNTIAWAWEKKTVASGGTLKVLIDVTKLGKLFPVNA